MSVPTSMLPTTCDIFRPFGEFMMIFGGSLNQCLIPLVILFALMFKNRDNLGASIALWWLGQNFIACRQISASDVPLSEIAVAAGFFDQSHFGRTFKQLTGMSPAAYRETIRSR